MGPATLKIRGDIPVQSSTVATVSHGDRLEILQRRRTFLRVRTAAGVEGWTDERQMLGPADMAHLRLLSETAAKMPSQGAVVPRYGDMRIYSLPSTGSPSFLTVKDKERVDVVAHASMLRSGSIARAPLLPRTPKKAPPPKKAKAPRYPLIPPPKLPAPPPDWDQKGDEAAEAEAAAQAAQSPHPSDDWSLIRTADGQAGWTLTRRLNMAIPDEVAQYAEGKRIVSYFSLGSVRDKDLTKEIWLWTTVKDGAHPYDFDSFRVFVWSIRRRHYETAHIESNLAGFQPVIVETVSFAPSTRGRPAGPSETHPGFSICMERANGERRRRQYALIGEVIRYAGDRPCEAPVSLDRLLAPSASGLAPGSLPAVAPAETESFGQRWKRRVHSATHGWFGK